jgi:hypothetical protein
MYSLTVFKNRYDNKTHRRLDFDSWDKFKKFLYKLSERPLNDKLDAELISPSSYVKNTTRANKNVLDWGGWAAVDVDDYEPQGDLESDLIGKFGNYRFIVYSTASSNDTLPKFRIVFPLTERLEADRIKHFWFALNSEINSLGDKQTKDLSRMYYVPAAYNKANNFIFSNDDGIDIDPSALMAKWEYSEKQNSKDFLDRLPDAWKEQIIEYRKSKLDNTSYVWSSYSDCPFVNKTLLREYMSIANIDGTGRYRMIYKMMISIAGNAIEKQYPITASQIVDLVRQLDKDTANIYENRPLDTEANNALEYAYKNGVIQ